MHPDRQSTRLPPPPRRGRDWGAVVAKVFCFVFALVGVLPVAAATAARSPQARRWAADQTVHLLAEQGVVARFEVELRLWPLSLELTHLQVNSSDGGAPLLTSPRANVRPRVFALLSGKVAIDQIEVDAPHVRAVVKDGRLTNVKLPAPSPKAKGPLHAPFSVFSIADATIDADIEGLKIDARELDLDVTADDDPGRGSSFEIAVRAGVTNVSRRRITSVNGIDAYSFDDDSLCAVDARVRVEPDLITVRRLHAAGSADLDASPGTGPGCHLDPGDKRNVELALNHLRVALPPPEKTGGPPVKVDGHVKVRIPVGLAERLVHLPETDGWLGVDADVRYGDDTVLPDVSGHVEAHGIRISHFSFAQEVQSDLSIHANVITSPLTVIRIADGTATFTDTEVDPLAKGATLKTKLEVRDVNFSSLVRDLGVHPHPYVGWDLREIHLASLTGTLLPLHLDGDFTGAVGGFEVDDMPHENPAHARIFATKDVQLRAHLSVRPYGVEFKSVEAKLPGSHFENAFVSLHFNNDLKIDIPTGKVDLADCTPLGTIPIGGQVDVEAHVTGNFSDPHLEADASIRDFVFGDIPFGNVTAGHASLTGLVLDLKKVKAQKGKSAYEMPTARLDFSSAGMKMDAQFASAALGLRDFLAIWKMEEDPRFLDLDASLATHGRLHVALGGPEDVCGNGLFDVHATAHATGVDLYGELFDEGDADFEYRWTDRLAGIDGADIEIPAFTLHKGKGAAGPITGAVLGSATIAKGGDVNGNLVVQAIPLSRIQTLGPMRSAMEGTMSGTLQMTGKLDAYAIRGDVDVTPTRIRGALFGPSHLVVGMTQDLHPARRLGATRCGAPLYAPFDKEAYLRDASSQGHYEADGDLLGGQIHLGHVTMTRQRAAQVAGTIAFRQLDVGKVLTALVPREENDASPEIAKSIDGQLSGDAIIDRLVVSDLANAKARFVPGTLTLTRAGQRVVLRPTKDTMTLSGDVLSLPPLTLDLEASGGLKGALVLQGTVSQLSTSPELGLSAELEPIDLGLLVSVIPKLERSIGTLSGRMSAKGKLSQPQIAGEVHVKGGEFAVHGWPSDVSEVDVDAVADSQEVRITRGAAKFAGGTISLTGSMPLKRFELDKAEATVVAHDIRIAPSPGVQATVDADLNLAWNAQATGSPTASLPHVGGDVLITSFEYTRPISLELTGFGVRSKRTDVETYDPSLDKIVFDSVRVRSRAPLKIHNNLVEVQLGIDSGALVVSGTDQRIGLRGELRAQPGGRFHLRANDFDVRQAIIRFDDPTRIAANVDLLAVTEYRRYSDTSAGAAAGATGGGGLWRISLHAYGDTENLRFEMTSDPPLSQEDIVLLLTIGMTRAEVDQIQAGSLGTSLALEALATASGADRAVKTAIPVIDDFRFGSAYSTLTGRTEPQVIVGKRLTDSLRANVATTLAEDREIRSNIEWRLNRRVSVQASYDNINDVSSSNIGNIGVDFRWRLEFE